MAALDDQFIVIINNIRGVINQYRITTSIGATDTVNFIPGKGESVYSTFLRVVGFLKYSQAINAQIPEALQIADGQNIVDRLLKPKDSGSQTRTANMLNFLQALQQQIEKYVREDGLISLRRIIKQIGPPSQDPRGDSQQTSVTFTNDINANTRLVNEQLALYSQQEAQFGQLVTEIDLLSLFLSNLNSVVNDVVTVGGTSTNVQDQPLGPMAGPFVSLIQSQALGYQQQLNSLVNTRVALNSNLILLQQKMRSIRTGLALANKEPVALLSIVNGLLFLMQSVSYTCANCQYYSTSPVAGQVNPSSLTPDQQAGQAAIAAASTQRVANATPGPGAAPGYCTYRIANFPTQTSYSCNEVWGLINNDFWTASSDNQNGRVDILTQARKKLDPRNP